MQTIHKQSRIKLYLLLIIFIIPLLASWFLFYFHTSFQLKTTNHGIFVSPPIKLQNDNPKKWRILYLTSTICDSHCENIGYQLKQLKIALGKESNRVIVLQAPGQDWKFLLSAFVKHGEKNFEIEHKIYLIDPINNLFMYYPDSTNPMNILKDLKKVLEVSQIG